MKENINAQSGLTKFNDRLNNFILFCIGLVVTFTLINSTVFIYSSLASYFLYTAGISLLIILSGIQIIKNQGYHSLQLSAPVFIMICWILYVLINGKLKHNVNSSSLYLCFNGFFFLIIFGLGRIIKKHIIRFFWIFGILGVFEAIVCLLQASGSLSSMNRYFPVTGSWGNPNVTAMFMALVIPAVLSLLVYKQKNRPVLLLILSAIVVALILLKCRTAYIGATVACLVVLNYRFRFIKYLYSRLDHKTVIALGIACVIVIASVGYKLYGIKKESAEGRKLIWKLSLAMLKEQPITGYGYGTFEKEYNLYQARYFENADQDTPDLKTAGYVKMGYNEFLQNTVEGGIIGLLILFSLFLSLLVSPKLNIGGPTKKADLTDQVALTTAYGSVIAFMIMCLVNFTIQAIPAMSLFIFYSALISARPDIKSFSIDVSSTINLKPVRLGLGISLLFLGVFVMYDQITLIQANRQNKTAAELARGNHLDKALKLLKPLKTRLFNYESYWKNYGEVLYRKGQFDEAITMLTNAKEYSASPSIYRLSALCFEQIGKRTNAVKNYLQAAALEPNRIGPKFELMRCYLSYGDRQNAILMAKTILQIQPKVPSDKGLYYKREAAALLQKEPLETSATPRKF